MITTRCAAFVLAVAFSVTGTAQAGETAALVLDYTGKSNPLLQSYSELPAGAKIELGTAGTLTLLHYKTCRTITITGGAVAIGADEVEVKGGTRSQDASDQCPQEIKLKVSGIGGGVLMRGNTKLPPSATALPASLACGLVGGKADKVTGVSLKDRKTILAEMTISAHRLALPPDAPPLLSGHDYTLLVSLRGTPSPQALPISITDTPAASPCLIRID